MKPDQMARRIACISLPNFPIERRMRQLARAAQHQAAPTQAGTAPLAAPPQAGTAPLAEAPFALWIEGTHGPIIHAANPAAQAAGIAANARLGGRP